LPRLGVAVGLVVALMENPLAAEEEVYGPPLLKRLRENRAERVQSTNPPLDPLVIDTRPWFHRVQARRSQILHTNGLRFDAYPDFRGRLTRLTDIGVGAPEARANPILDRIWSWPLIYRNPDALFLQEFLLFGRYHGQYYSVSSAQGSAKGWENRRSRIGARAIFLESFTAAANFNAVTDSGKDLSNVIDKENIDTLPLAWTPNENFQAVIGRQKAGFSYEYDVLRTRC